ncbi:hypothetical protein HY486_03610 [Candidatus Woesearchaeota archaeon]|nr:hypothetical protein [Candidatus Woesearchaeota archaeon]
MEIDALKKGLKELSFSIRHALKKRREIGRAIADKINLTKKLRSERNTLTDSVKQLKGERRQYNSQLKDDLIKVRGMPIVKSKAQMLRYQIEKMEYDIETAGMAFEKEEKVMKQINKLKKELAQEESKEKVTHERTEIKKHLTEARKHADDLHGNIQDIARQSQEKHEQILKLNEDIDRLRQEEEAIIKDIEKNEVKEKELCAELDVLLKKAGEQTMAEKRQHEVEMKKLLHDKKRNAELKLQRGEKLNTEEFLALQG